MAASLDSSDPRQWLAPAKWAKKDATIQLWATDFIWGIIRCISQRGTSSPTPPPIPEAVEHCLEVLDRNELLSMVQLAYGPEGGKILGAPFEKLLQRDIRRSEILLSEVHWLLLPKMSTMLLPIDAFAIRDFYSGFVQKINPRLIRNLVLWLPTMPSREEVIGILGEGKYKPAKSSDDRTYVFKKTTQGIDHQIRLRSLLWEASKNWSFEYERNIWDRAEATVGPEKKLDPTDLFILTSRLFSIDSLCGSAALLLDMIMILDRLGDGMDWVRLQSMKNSLTKPAWIWAAFAALEIFEQKTGMKVNLPEWGREILKEVRTTFLYPFIDSRLNFGNPDTRFTEFSRAYVKCARGE